MRLKVAYEDFWNRAFDFKGRTTRIDYLLAYLGFLISCILFCIVIFFGMGLEPVLEGVEASYNRIIYGFGLLHLIPFTLALSKMHPEEFALKFLINRFNLKKLVIGYDFRFGKHRAGDFKLLENLSRKFNFSIEEIPLSC